MNRLFIAAEIPDKILEQIIRIRNEIYPDADVRWEKKEKLHLTLKFLGDVNVDLIPDLKSSLEDILNSFNKIELKFSHFGMFYFKRKPRILWLGLNYPPELFDIYSRINSEFIKFGFEKEKRKFNPHLTILRIRGNENIGSLKKFLDVKIDLPEFDLTSIILFKSTLMPGGSIYEKLESFELK